MNAAVFACRMLALNDPALAKKLAAYRDAMRAKVERADDELRAKK